MPPAGPRYAPDSGGRSAAIVKTCCVKRPRVCPAGVASLPFVFRSLLTLSRQLQYQSGDQAQELYCEGDDRRHLPMRCLPPPPRLDARFAGWPTTPLQGLRLDSRQCAEWDHRVEAYLAGTTDARDAWP